MNKHGKKYISARGKINTLKKGAYHSAQEGLTKVKELAYARFDETVTVDVNLGIDASKGDQVVRGSVLLPHSVGKVKRVLVFAKGDYVDEATKAGADYVGAEDLIEKIESGWLDFDYAVATPDLMGLVGKVARVLGPRGLLPNKKSGTVTFEIESTVSDLKKGRLFFKNDKNGIVHFAFGKVSFPVEKLKENLQSFAKALAATRPAAAKGVFIKKMTVSSTMGIGLPIAVDDVL